MDLWQRFRAGDREAFTALYRTHHTAVFRFAFYMTGDRTRATEITQDAFVWLIHHPDQFDPARGELGAFLGGVARKLMRQQQRREGRWRPLDESIDFGTHRDDATAREIDTCALRKAIALLPERYREAVVLCDLESKSYEEAAAAAGCPVGTVRSRLHRARQLLARKLLPKRGTRSLCL
jgi:RNA polymerase sigma-70 factor (ECF subfamily)